MRQLPSTPIASRRGVARISAVWMIVVVVLLFVVLGYAYIAQDEAATSEQARVTAKNAEIEADKRLVTVRDDLRLRSGVLGFTTDAATQASNVESAEAGLKELGDVFPDFQAVKTYQDAIPVVKAAYSAQTSLIGELRTRIGELEGQLTAERASKSQSESDKDKIIADLRTELSDNAETAQGSIDRLETAKATLQDQVSTLGEQITALQDQARKSDNSLAQAKVEFASVGQQLRTRLNDIQKRAEKPDGEISAVSASLGTAFINLAAKDRLSEGIEFDIVSGSSPDLLKSPKGRARVIDVGPERSEVRITFVADPLGQPIVAGDKIFNPLFEKSGQRNAVLAGNISGAYNEPEMIALLKEIGITVQPTVSNTTDFLITGGAMYIDDEGEPLEEPLRPEDLPVYGEARDLGVVVIPARDVMQYFRR